MEGKGDACRVVARVGPGGAGKTSLAEALLFAGGAINRQGSVEAGTSVGAASAEARARKASTEPNLMRFDFMGAAFGLIATPGSVRFAAGGTAAIAASALPLAHLAPDPAPAGLSQKPLHPIAALTHTPSHLATRHYQGH